MDTECSNCKRSMDWDECAICALKWNLFTIEQNRNGGIVQHREVCRMCLIRMAAESEAASRVDSIIDEAKAGI